MMQETIYLDNAATTALEPLVLEEMLPFLTTQYGNPSSAYSLGRQTRGAVETARKNVAGLLGVKPLNIFFNSGGTEGNNTAISMAVNTLGCGHIITSPLEHHAVLNTVKHYCAQHQIGCSYVALTDNGEIDYTDLEKQVAEVTSSGKRCLITLMHANNEIGTLLDLAKTGEIAKQYDAIFHSDCVQTIGHYPLNLSEYYLHFATASGHKFHGPKGTGILYVRDGIKAAALLHGGSQERGCRAGTENVYGIIGFAKALSLSMDQYEKEHKYISSLKDHMRSLLTEKFPGVTFNSPQNSLYTVLSVCFPGDTDADMLVTQLDIAGVCASGGSACSAGHGGSHVISALNRNASGPTIRFSFSKFNTADDIEKAIAAISRIWKS